MWSAHGDFGSLTATPDSEHAEGPLCLTFYVWQCCFFLHRGLFCVKLGVIIPVWSFAYGKPEGKEFLSDELGKNLYTFLCGDEYIFLAINSIFLNPSITFLLRICK